MEGYYRITVAAKELPDGDTITRDTKTETLDLAIAVIRNAGRTKYTVVSVKITHFTVMEG